MSAAPRIGIVLPVVFLLLSFGIEQGQADRPQTAGPAVSRDWKRLKSRNFIAEGTVSARLMERWLEDLEAFRSCMAAALPSVSFASPVPNRIIVLDDARALLALAPLQLNGRPDPKVGGYFQSAPEANYLVLSNQSSGLETLYHEYSHFILHHAFSGPIPTWADEGLAEFHSTFRLDRGKKLGILGSPIPRFSAIADGRLIPLRKLISEDEAARLMRDEVDVQRFYAQSWALVHYLSIGNKGARSGQFSAYLNAVASGTPGEKAFEDSFRVTPEALLDELRVYLSGLTIPAAGIPLAEGTTEAGSPETMFEWEAQLLKGRILTTLGRVDDAEKVLAQAEAAAPHDAGVLHAVAALRRIQDRPAEAIARLESALAQQQNSFASHLEYALALSDVGQHAAAIPEYERAAAINPAYESVWFGLSLSLAAVGRHDHGDAAFRRLKTIDPDPDWYRRRSQAAWAHGLDSIVVDDALRYVEALGFKTESGMYTALHAAMAGRRINADAKVNRLLEGVQAVVTPKSWPAAILAFLKKEISSQELLSRAKGNGQLTEAHAHIGLVASIEGREDEAVPHLQWVVDRGLKNFVEYQLVLGEMKRRAARK